MNEIKYQKAVNLLDELDKIDSYEADIQGTILEGWKASVDAFEKEDEESFLDEFIDEIVDLIERLNQEDQE